jgi:hypothetical protein
MNGLQMKYFVLNPHKKDAYGKASRLAIQSYALSISATNPRLSDDLQIWVQKIESTLTVKCVRKRGKK